jgi:hypothetical protein
MPAQVKVGNEALHPHLRQASMTGKEKGGGLLVQGGACWTYYENFSFSRAPIAAMAYRGGATW